MFFKNESPKQIKYKTIYVHKPTIQPVLRDRYNYTWWTMTLGIGAKHM